MQLLIYGPLRVDFWDEEDEEAWKSRAPGRKRGNMGMQTQIEEWIAQEISASDELEAMKKCKRKGGHKAKVFHSASYRSSHTVIHQPKRKHTQLVYVN